MTWKRGTSGNPRGRPVGIASHRKIKINTQGEVIKDQREGEEREIDMLTRVAEVVFNLAIEGNPWAIEHISNRLDGKVKEHVEVRTNTNIKVRYESYEEVRAALLEEGINIDRLPMLEDLRSVEEQEPEQEPS
jgi:Family of unknown function (DUF5681)